MFEERLAVTASGVTLMRIKVVLRKFPREPYHALVADNLGADRGERDDRYLLIPSYNGELVDELLRCSYAAVEEDLRLCLTHAETLQYSFDT